MTADHVQNLVDLDPVQGYRIGADNFHRLLNTNSADPFGHGSHLAGKHRGSVAREGSQREPRLVTELLRSLDGSLPDYLLEALQGDLIADDQGLHDFLGVFDKRLLQLWLASEQRANLVSEADAEISRQGVITGGMSRLLGGGSAQTEAAARLLPALLALVLRSQNLETLRRVLSWLTEREVRIRPRFNHKHHLDPDCRLRITRAKGQGNALGRGLVIGLRALPASGRLEIEILCRDAEDLADLRYGQPRLAAIHTLTSRFLRDPVPVSYFARVARRHLDPPRLSRDRGLAVQLGPRGCLDPAAKPEATTRVKLDVPITKFSGGHS
jgi:predicted component of type VI protein secretion system